MLSSAKHENILELTGITVEKSETPGEHHEQYSLLFHRCTCGSLKNYLTAKKEKLSKDGGGGIMYSWAFQVYASTSR